MELSNNPKLFSISNMDLQFEDYYQKNISFFFLIQPVKI